MPAIETIVRPRRNRISIAVPREYGSYSFQVILVPIADGEASPYFERSPRKTSTFVDALLDCPKLEQGESLVGDRRVWDVPSAFDRAGCFDAEDFA